eukprot:6957029-Prymnesium_polylepis.1
MVTSPPHWDGDLVASPTPDPCAVARAQNATVAWFESPSAPRRGPGRLAAAAFWRCTVVVPYIASPFCKQQRDAHPARSCLAPPRTTPTAATAAAAAAPAWWATA